jgi:large subunit ribosomal protein L10
MAGRGSVRPEKIARVDALAKTVLGRPVTALVGLRGVPAAALQSMRRELRARGHPIVVSQNSAIRHALTKAAQERPALKPLLDHVQDQTAVLAAEGNPFSLSRELLRTRSPTPARGGEIAPRDIVVPAGTTSFKPGPIVGELQQAGFPAAIEKGKVVLKKDALVVKAGEPIPRAVASLLTRLEIFPLEVGLSLRALVEGETFYAPEVLRFDPDAYLADLTSAARRALGLAVELGYATPSSMPFLIGRAHRRALALAARAGVPLPETIPSTFVEAFRPAAPPPVTGT